MIKSIMHEILLHGFIVIEYALISIDYINNQ